MPASAMVASPTPLGTSKTSRLRPWLRVGRELYVSLNTVKTHVRNIYAKLRVGSREDAVRRARELKLL